MYAIVMAKRRCRFGALSQPHMLNLRASGHMESLCDWLTRRNGFMVSKDDLRRIEDNPALQRVLRTTSTEKAETGHIELYRLSANVSRLTSG